MVSPQREHQIKRKYTDICVDMPTNIRKVQKKITKKKGGITSLHENSRDAQKMRRASARSGKLEKLAAARSKAHQPLCRYHLSTAILGVTNRVLWQQ